MKGKRKPSRLSKQVSSTRLSLAARRKVAAIRQAESKEEIKTEAEILRGLVEDGIRFRELKSAGENEVFEARRRLFERVISEKIAPIERQLASILRGLEASGLIVLEPFEVADDVPFTEENDALQKGSMGTSDESSVAWSGTTIEEPNDMFSDKEKNDSLLF